MGFNWNPLAWWDNDAEYSYVGPATRYVSSTPSIGNDDSSWSITTTTYNPADRKVFYHPSRSGPTWKNTSQRVTRRQLSRYTKA